ncbi:RNA methyltransferase [Glutamicibacter sp. MNS18]|uniref:TrmH family RNA methyltransferase n=1 Tax=Glutamicibacter sp. MNS18 TaxID=2989817 RepID=UPI0022361201|nr:RNA methyltransferase [Glutamicibacter sp. MNS18]MCW4465366.1 RNA methyltransferase [Glutamicibacter sp. MNS18]
MTSYNETVMSNPRADKVKAVARLATRSGRKATGHYLVEGPQAVREALKAEAATGGVIVSVYATETFLGSSAEFSELLQDARVQARAVTDEVLAAMADTITPQGIIAVARVIESGLEEILEGKPQLIAVLCRVQDPGNAGTILRAADAAGADAVIFTKGSVDIYNPKTVRSTVGSLFHLPVLGNVDFDQLLRLAAGQGIQLLAADGYAEHDLDALQDAAVLHHNGTGPAQSAQAPELTRPTAWLFGNEGQGLDEAEKAAAHYKVAVPLYGVAESLNVSTAATLCLYASARAQRNHAH